MPSQISNSPFKRPCIFCLETNKKMSHEHVFGDWANQILPGIPNSRRNRNHVRAVHIDNKTKEINLPTRKMGQGHAGHTKCYDVCQDCNTGWMGSLESLTKPILSNFILGNKLWLTIEECKIITIWAIKAFLALEHTYRDLVVIKDEERKFFYDGYINPDWSILVGKYRGLDKAVYKIESRRICEHGEEVPKGDYLARHLPKELKNTLIGTYIRGEFLIHLCRSDHSLCNYVNLANQPLYEVLCLERIWPLPSSDVWLSNLPYITRDLFDQVHFRELNWLMRPQYDALRPPSLLPVANPLPRYCKVFNKDSTGKKIMVL